VSYKVSYIVLDGDPAPHLKTAFFGPCLLWPNGLMVQDDIGTNVGLGPGHIVLRGDPAPDSSKRGTAPNFRRIFIVAKRSPISATAEQVELTDITSTLHDYRVTASQMLLIFGFKCSLVCCENLFICSISVLYRFFAENI